MKVKATNNTNLDKRKQYSISIHYGEKRLVDCMRAVILTTFCK
ncbi:MAG: hypothetical protein ACERKZ_03600 [Lachnotalea sp.]